ncbi:complement C1q tumor necrosis factor-related protein 6-like [Xiphophorus hellerii]|uniref:complement C1q tumor necrosis factor-related protein 6-like n=1 Tax=Xiphophorus hellerii TaxID=8084 RepID=UPI0013B46E9B|nr:complement C1q tumor necrosis factor-related protein 6-like [Xiphophorus hellerii]
MNFTFCVLVLFSGLTLVQSVAETETSAGSQSCCPDLSLFHQELSAVKTKLEVVETQLKETESQLLVLKEKEALKVVFSAATGGNGAIGPFSQHQTLVFRTVITNIGSAYNQHSGVFVAPVRGIYYFAFYYHASGLHPSYVHLMKNSNIVVLSSDQQTVNYGADNGGNAALLELQQGDQVYLQLAANNHVWGNDYHTTFSGFLLHQV